MFGILLVIFGIIALVKGRFQVWKGRWVSGTSAKALGFLMLGGAVLAFFSGEASWIVALVTLVLAIVIGLAVAKAE